MITPINAMLTLHGDQGKMGKMSQIIAVFHQAGGVGKSTVVMNIGYALAQQQHRVLLVDVDPQGSLSTFMGIDSATLHRQETIYAAVILEAPLPIQTDIHQMDIVPANLDFCAAEMELVTADMRDFRLQYALEPLRDRYDYILLDCPPSLGILTYISLVAATHILVPIETQFKAFQSTELLLHTVKRIRARPNRQLEIAGFLPTKYDQRNSLDREILAAIKQQLSGLATVYPPIPRATALADATRARQPLALYEARHRANQVFTEIAKEIEKL